MTRRLLILFFVYMLVEGVLRKWVFPGGASFYIAFKYMILAAALGLYFAAYRRVRTVNAAEAGALYVYGAIFIVFFVISDWNYEAFIALVYALGMLPIVFLCGELVSTRIDLDGFAKIFLVLTFGACLLGLVQFNSPVDAPINAYADSLELISDVAVIEDRITGFARARITGPFPYISGFAQFLPFALVLAWYCAYSQRGRWRWAGFACVIMVMGNLFMTGSRSVALTGAAISAVYLGLAIWGEGYVAGKMSKLLKMGMVAAVILIGVGMLYQLADTILYRNELASDADERVGGLLLAPLSTFEDAGLLGHGLGSTFTTSNFYQYFDEVAHERTMLEVGAVGFIVLASVRLILQGMGVMVWIRMRDKRLKGLALGMLMVETSVVWTLPYYQHVQYAIVMSSFGLLFALRRLDRLETPQTHEQAMMSRLMVAA